jgi:hypothetical protein
VPRSDGYNPVLQHYQVEIRGNSYYVIDTANRAIVGGPFRDRITAQEKADQLERRRPSRVF